MGKISTETVKKPRITPPHPPVDHMGSCQLESTDAPTQQPELLMDEVRMDTPPHMESDQLDRRSADGYTPPIWKATSWNHPGTSTQLLEQQMEALPSSRSC